MMPTIITSSVIGIASHKASASKITGRSIMHAPLMIQPLARDIAKEVLDFISDWK